MTPKTDEGLAPERRRRVPGWQSRDILRAGVLLTGLWFLLKLFWFAQPLILTVFLGVLFGLAVEGGVDRLQRFRVPRGVGAAAIVLAFFALLFGLGAWMAPTLREQGRELRTRLPQAIAKVAEWVIERRQGMCARIRGGAEVAAPPGGTAGARADTVAPPTQAPAPGAGRQETAVAAAAQQPDGPLSDR